MEKKRTLLEHLEEMAKTESALKEVQEIHYRIFVLKTEKELELAAVKLKDLWECKVHKDCVLRLCDFMVFPVYTPFSEGEMEEYEKLKSDLYTRVERPFYSIFDVSDYRKLMVTELRDFLSKWWKHREHVVKLIAH